MKMVLGMALAWFLTSSALATTHEGVQAYLDFDTSYEVPREKVSDSYLRVVPEKTLYSILTSAQEQKFELALSVLEETLNSEEFKLKQQKLLSDTLKKIDIVICTALIPGKKAPRIINEEMFKDIQAGSVIFDLAVEQGGNSAYSEIDKIINKNGLRDVVLMHCILNYPTPFEQAHLRMIKGLISTYPEHIIGYSDHTEDIEALYLAAITEADVLEFHFTDTKEGKTFRDHKVSLTKDDIDLLVNKINRANIIFGSNIKAPTKSELENKTCIPRPTSLKNNPVFFVIYVGIIFFNKKKQFTEAIR